jgi:cytochrome c peroxidase
VPSLRNVFLTFPYGHDGRFSTISDVLEHYNSGIVQSRFGSGIKRNSLSEDDRFYLIYFLETLTDSSFIRNPLYADPALGVRRSAPADTH